MKKNLFKLFTDKLLDYPIWVKQAVFLKLYNDLKDSSCIDIIKNSSQKIFPLYEPVITFEGENVIINKNKWLDNNIYNFLKLCHENYNLLEISLNTFLSLEETSKIFMFCIEQNYIKKPEEKNVYAAAGFLSGKFRTGEYFFERGMITQLQLAKVLEIKENSQKPTGEILVDMNCIKKEDLTILFTLKSDAAKRFVLDSSIYPECELPADEKEKFTAEISALEKENETLKLRMRRLLEIVSRQND